MRLEFQTQKDQLHTHTQTEIKSMENNTNAPSDVAGVREESKTFFGNLAGYVDCRTRFDKKYSEVDELQTIAKFVLKDDSGGIELGDGQFKPHYQQQTIEGLPVTNLHALYDAAEVAKPAFEKVITRLCNQVSYKEQGDESDDSKVTFAGENSSSAKGKR